MQKIHLGEEKESVNYLATLFNQPIWAPRPLKRNVKTENETRMTNHHILKRNTANHG